MRSTGTTVGMLTSMAVVGLLASASAFAQGQAQGPDVIVGEIPDVQNYGAATVGGVQYRAYAVGTTSCNMGTQRLTWIADNNTHPVISQNMYRLHNGRFEQIAQAWLKHGFCALQGNVCSSNCSPNPTGCPALGVLCSDPYSAGLNGSQSGLGPKSEINAANGAFPYPWINNGVSDNNTLFKRLRVAQNDIAVPGAQFFVSSMYVQSEDALADNDNNNESYRRVTFSANWDLQLQGATQRTKAGIYAWRDHGLGANTPDPDVNISTADVPGDGRFLIGSKVIFLGNGRYRYDYAVQNLTSDRSGASFTIPLPPGINANVGNLYFHDVEYHSGEPYNSLDWTAQVTSNAVTWSCTETAAQNVNANALRWDTIYTFSFEADVAPSAGAVTLGLFKPGAQNTVGGGAYIPSPDGLPHPFNDACIAPTSIAAGTTNFSSAGATTDGPDQPSACNAAGDTQIGNDVWFLYSAGAAAGDTVISTCGSSFNTKMAVYPAGACPTAGAMIACSDDSLFCAAGTGGSRLTFRAAANASYLIRIGGRSGATGDGVINITAPVPPGPTPPSNDGCAGSQWLADGSTVTGNTQLATTEGSSSCGNSGGDVWFAYRPTVGGQVIRAETCGSGFNTMLSVHTGTCGALSQVACNDNAQTGTCANSNQSLAAWIGQANTTYYIRLAGLGTARGNYNLTVTGGSGVIPPTAPANDLCANRTTANLGSNTFSTIAAATDGPAHASCQMGAGVNTISNDVWYNFNATTSGPINAMVTSDGFSPEIAVYDGNGCGVFEQRLVSCGDRCSGNYGEVTFNALGGQSYTIRVGGGAGSGRLVLSNAQLCAADLDDGNGLGVPDGGVSIDDLLYYLSAFDAGSTAADFDDGSNTGTRDCAATLDDLLYYLARYEGGC